MKFTALAALFGYASSQTSNPVPIQRNIPGYLMGGTKVGNDVRIRLFTDALCPDSYAAYKNLKELLTEDSKVAGKKYSDLVELRIIPFVLPYHLHSYAVTQVMPYLADVCTKTKGSECHLFEYMEYAWEQMDEIKSQKNVSKNDFVQDWAQTIEKLYDGVQAKAIENLFTPTDPLLSDIKTRANWKYATSVGVQGTPTAWAKGVETYVPEDKAGW